MLNKVKIKDFDHHYSIQKPEYDVKLLLLSNRNIWEEIESYFCSKLSPKEKDEIKKIFHNFYNHVIKLIDNAADTDYLTIISLELLKMLMKSDGNVISIKQQIVKKHGIDNTKAHILDDMLLLTKSLKNKISDCDYELLDNIDSRNISTLLYANRPMFGKENNKPRKDKSVLTNSKILSENLMNHISNSKIICNVIKSDVTKVEPKSNYVKCDNSLKSLLNKSASSLNIDIDQVVSNVSTLLKSNKSNDEIQEFLFDFLGFNAFDVIMEILSKRSDLISESQKCNYTNIVDELINDPQAHLHRKAAQILQKPQIVTNSSICVAPPVKYPFVFDRMADMKAMGVNKICLPKDAVQKSTKFTEEVYIPPGTNSINPSDFKKISISSLDEIGRMGFQGMTSLNVIQSVVYPQAYGTNENLLICAPTGAGKTNIAMLTILHQIKQHIGEAGKIQLDKFKIIYVAPMKALAAEMTENFGKRLKPLGIVVKECTGDVQLTKKEISDTQMIVTTPEKYDVLTRKSTGDTALVQLVKLLIIDEIHLLHEERGGVIESLVARTLRQVESNQSTIRIVGLSATLPNYLDVAEFCAVNPFKGLFYFDGRFRPVPLHQTLIGIKGTNTYQIEQTMDEECYEQIMKYLRQKEQVMVFVHSRNATGRVARKMRDFMKERQDVGVIDENLHGREYSLALKKVERSRDNQLKDLFKDGIAPHHAGMLRCDRSFVESNFKQGYIRVLVCTSTLAWGVNLPAHTVIIRGTEYYDGEKSSFQDIGILDVLQIFGRAGRPQFDTEGHGIIMCKHDKLSHYISLLTKQYPIESQFLSSLNDNLNAEIVLGSVSSIEEAARWLGYTYLFVRMRKNPLIYGILKKELRNDPDLMETRMNFITESARQLDKAKLIRFDERTGYMNSTDSGRLASHFYIKYETALAVEENFNEGLSIINVFGLIADSKEFSQMKVRDDEIAELDQIRDEVCQIEMKHDTSDIAGKVNSIIQAYIDRYKPESFSLASDLNYVSGNIGRITRYLFEKAIRIGWPLMTSTMLKLCKMVEHRLWEASHPLWQFHPEINVGILERCKQKNLNIDKIRSLDTKSISSMIGYGESGIKIKQFTGYIPLVDVEIDVQPITRTILRIRAKIIPQFRWNDHYHGNSELFWVWVEDPDSNNIHYSEQITITKKQVMSQRKNDKKSRYDYNSTQQNDSENLEMVFAIPISEPKPNMYLLRIVSDRWIGSDHSHVISFNDLILPELHPPHTNLLDLRPLPLGALNNPAYEQIYTFSHFNTIQTQMFHSVYHSDVNILLGAPTGSGKTVAAELAIFRLFTHYPGKKVVYIAPLKALVRERMEEWKKKFTDKLGKKVVELTGDIAPDMKAVSQSDIIITTPEKWDGISRSWQERSFVQDCSLIIIDEIHLLGEDRGPVLEVIVSRTNFISARTGIPVRVIGLSTALANARDLADWLHIPVNSSGLFNFRPSVRPVPLQAHIQGFPGRHYCPRMATMNKPIFQNIKTNSPTKPVLIFVSSRRQTRLTAFDLISFLAVDMTPKEWLDMEDDELSYIIDSARDTNLKLTLAYGIGMHHAGLHDKDRKLVEYLFMERKIQVLIATSTLAWGVNFPAHMVVVKGTEYFDGPTKRYIDYPITDVLQMMGRAGRPQFDENGKAVIMVHDIKKDFYKKFLYEPFPVESSLLNVLPDHLSAEITAGTITSKQAAMNYITWTFFFRRLLMNPNYYNLTSVDHSSINNYLSGLVETIIGDLEASHCVEVDPDDGMTLEPGIMGRIASYYYLKHKSVRLFKSRLNADSSLEEILSILSDTEEFGELPVRHNEDQLNIDLSKSVPIKLNQSTMDSPHTKANLLLQAHFSRVQLPIVDYYVDTKLVLDQAIRIVQAMIDAAASEGALATSLQLVQTIQMIVQGIWVPKDNALLQLPKIELHHLQYIRHPRTNQLITSIPELMEIVKGRYDLLKTVFGSGFDKSEVDSIFEVLNRYPIMEVSIRVRSSLPKSKFDKLSDLVANKTNSDWIIPRERKIQKNDDNDENEDSDDDDDEEPRSHFSCDVSFPNLYNNGDCVIHSMSSIQHLWKQNAKNIQRIWAPVGCDEECVLDITLHRINYSEVTGIPKAYAPRFPKPKDEGYILIIGDPETKEVLAIRRVPMIRQSKTRVQMTFYSPNTIGRALYRLYVMSDCYVSVDQEVLILLDAVNV